MTENSVSCSCVTIAIYVLPPSGLSSGLADAGLALPKLQIASGLEHGVDNLGVSSASAKVSSKRVPHFRLCWLQGLGQQRRGAHEDSGRAIPALRGAVGRERILQRIHLGAFGERLDR